MKNNWKLTLFGLLLSVCAFGQWTPQSSGVREALLDIAFIDADFGVAAGQNGTILLTNNGGVNWAAAAVGERVQALRSVLPLSKDTILVAESSIFDGKVYRTSDGGQSWEEVSDGAFLAKAQSGILALSYETLHYSTDRGDAWADNDPGIGGTLLMERLIFADETHGYIMGDVSGFASYSSYGFRTADGGAAWAPLWVFDLPNSNAFSSFSAPSPDTAYLFGNQQVSFLPGPINTLVRMTGFYFDASDNRNSWRFQAELVNDDMPGLMLCSAFVDGQTGYAGSADGIIYATQNGGVDWSPEYMGADTIHQIKIMSDGSIYAVGSNGLILRRSIASKAAEVARPFALEVFPNPSQDWLHVKEAPVEQAQAYLSSYNGQLIRSFNWRQGAAIDISKLEAGWYLLELQVDLKRYLARFQKR